MHLYPCGLITDLQCIVFQQELHCLHVDGGVGPERGTQGLGNAGFLAKSHSSDALDALGLLSNSFYTDTGHDITGLVIS